MTTHAALPTGEWMSHSPEETQALGAHFGQFLRGGEILLLSGQLGAGKTLFVKGVAEALGIPEDEVTSPSFTLVNHYNGRLKLYHIDLYRLNEGAQAAHAVDLDELLMDESAVIIIEWAERMGAYPLPEPVLRIRITGDGEEPRAIHISNAQSPGLTAKLS
ncbi:MAG: tRNA (adenosine(37)-N6)-threonylcarbamoyltransferase complex ATPase subunit type 1 TsaE [Pyrinomonadaceae bacterium]|nr:tRNA (adenosine(37)-N6)-threonylcarbamoyltransferase complex ATPase subunit type 1 TsaE [Pyrinomonadaceae bacterium]